MTSQDGTRVILCLQLDHIEVALGRTAYRTDPVVWNVGPPGAGSQALVRVTLSLVIDVAAGPALPGFIGLVAHRGSSVFGSLSGMARKLSYLFDMKQTNCQQAPPLRSRDLDWRLTYEHRRHRLASSFLDNIRVPRIAGGLDDAGHDGDPRGPRNGRLCRLIMIRIR